MAVWLCRAGRLGEYEARFLEDNKIFYTFEEIDKPLTSFSTKRDLQKYFLLATPCKDNAAKVFATQGFAFCNEMQPGDWVITPSKTSPGIKKKKKILGDYTFSENAEDSYRHSRTVEWFAEMNRNQFEQDIQYAFSVPQTTYKIKQDDRIKQAVSQFLEIKTEHMFPPPEKFGARIVGRNRRFYHTKLQGKCAHSHN